MLISDLSRAMNEIAPLRYAEPWDNVGLLLGDASRPLRGSVLLTIDLTEAVVREAREMGASAVVAYHPPIFHALKRITTAGSAGTGGTARVLIAALEAGLAVYSPHTSLDGAPGGMTDWVADGLINRCGTGSGDRRALRPHLGRRETEEVKIVTFVPGASVHEVRAALASGGAGKIGNYELCSFTSPGTGTFFGVADAEPAVGAAGRLEQVDEVRLEMVCSRRALPVAVETLRQFHPYEEPAIDVYELVGRPERSAGAGRRIKLDQPTTVERLAQAVKEYLGVQGVYVAKAAGAAGEGKEEGEIDTVGVCCGSGGELVDLARAEGCHVYVTGEMKHHETLAAVEAGMSVITAGHTATERGYLPHLATKLRERLAGLRVEVSRADRSPFVLM